MVFVTVSNDYATYTVFLIIKITGIRNNEIDAKHFVVGKHNSSIHNDDIVSVLDDHHILSDFP